MSKGILIVGAGGHGRVVADTARQQGLWDRLAFLDDAKPRGSALDGATVLGSIDEAERLRTEFPSAAIALGDPHKRLELIAHFMRLGFDLPTIKHPSAAVSSYSTLGAGTVVFAQAAINAGSSLGTGCIINTGAGVDHDCTLGDGVHVSPGAHLGGGVTIGQGSWIGIGACVRENTTIGSWVTIGAGAAVVTAVANSARVAGVPARSISTRPR